VYPDASIVSTIFPETGRPAAKEPSAAVETPAAADASGASCPEHAARGRAVEARRNNERIRFDVRILMSARYFGDNLRLGDEGSSE
jgi:hypothetical protein